MLDTNRTTGAQMSRELRSENRRNLAALGDAEFADHFKFSQLKVGRNITEIHLFIDQQLVEEKTSSICQIEYSFMGFICL